MGTKLSKNKVAEWNNYWYDEIVTTCIDSFLTDFLARSGANCKNRRRINCFADDPDKGFLKASVRAAVRGGRTPAEDDYVGFVTADQHSQIESKINSLYSGTGTKAAKALIKAFKGLGEGAKEEYEGIYVIAQEAGRDLGSLGLQGARPMGRGFYPDEGQAALKKNDILFGTMLLYTARSYKYGRTGVYGQGPLPSMILGDHTGTPRGYVIPGIAQVPGGRGHRANPEYKVVANTGDNAFSSNNVAMMEWATKQYKNAGPAQRKGSLKKMYRVPGQWFFSWGIGGVQKPLQDFISRIARNYPDIIETRIDQMLDGILQDLSLSPEVYSPPTPPRKKAPEPKPPTPRTDKKAHATYGQFIKPFDLQCFLMENIGFLSTIKDGSKPYKFLGRADTRGSVSNPGNVVSAINHGARDEAVQSILEMCPDVYASLVPSIEIYRVDYKGKDILQPFREVKIPFPNFIDPNDVDLIGEGLLGRIPGAGIKSFSWNLEGVNPAEVDNNITANLVLHFQTIQDLFALNRNDKGEYILQAGAKDPGYLDLVIKSGTSFNETPVKTKNKPPKNSSICDVESEHYDGASFRIKAVVGWNAPSLEALMDAYPSMTHDRATAFKVAIDRTKTALYLDLTRHELTFNEDGTVELSINYQASLSGILRAPIADIFSGDTRYSEILDSIDKEVEELEDAVEQQRKAANASENDVESGDHTKLDKKLEEQINLEEKDKMLKYGRFLDKLYKSGKIYGITVSGDTYREGLISSKQYTPKERAQMAKTRLSAAPDKRGFGDPQQSNSFDTSLLDKLAKFQATSGNTVENPLVADDEFDKYAGILVKEHDDGSIVVPFFYLGDLFDSILDHLSFLPVDKDGKNGSFQLILSTMEMIDPLLIFQVKGFEIDCVSATTRRLVKRINDIDPMRFAATLGNLMFGMNLGSVPISLNYFQEWFVNQVVRPQRTSYSLLSFIKDVCANLITKAFNSLCFDDALTYNLKFDTAVFRLDSSFVGQDVSVVDLVTSKAIADHNSLKILDREFEDSVAPTIPSMVLYCVDSRPRTGDYEQDLQAGIYHYFLGAACGLPKNIKFNRMDMPYYREARISKNGSLGAQQLRELYSVSMDMIGNTLHKNGQYIYIEPIGVGLGSVRATGNVPNLARMLGIGGYHMVTKVNSTISAAGYSVSLDALQTGMSFGDSKIVSVRAHAKEGIFRSTYGEHGVKDKYEATSPESIPISSGFIAGTEGE